MCERHLEYLSIAPERMLTSTGRQGKQELG
jgi:hypothetical protein